MLALLSGTCTLALAQQPLDLEQKVWPAHWITPPDITGEEYGVYLFRKTFEKPAGSEAFPIHISADNRYQLYVNGEYVGKGPARGDLHHWHYETYDLAPVLKPGENTLAVRVWNYAEHMPVAQISFKTSLIVQGGNDAAQVVNTGENGWKVFTDPSHSPLRISGAQVMGYFVVGPGEKFEAAKHPWGWEQPGFDDSAWLACQQRKPGYPARGTFRNGGVPDYMLVPRSLPAMEKTEQPLGTLRRSGPQVQGEGSFTIPANTKATLLFDHGTLTTAYPRIAVEGGDGASIKLIYAESLRDSQKEKGHRDEIEGKEIYGFHDIFVADGGSREFRTLWWRTFRYVQMEVETGSEPLTFNSLKSDFTAYPFEEKAVFEAQKPLLNDIWEVGWRTQRLCAGETFFDCPYYEQLQYVGDTRLQALISLYVSGDDKLFKQSITAFHLSRLPFGLTQSRYPSHARQIIPTYSLFWIAMLHDYYMHVPEPETVERMLPAVADVLEWYEQRMAENGLNDVMEWWNFVDWVEDPAWKGGVPTGAETGGSSIISLQLAYNLQLAADLFEAFGNGRQAESYRQRADRINQQVLALCYDEGKGLLANTPEKKHFSQHASVMAILTGAWPDEKEKEVMKRVLEDKSLAQCSYYYFFYLVRALEATGMQGQYLQMLKPWEQQLELGLTTFVEEPDPTRSDCHAWSASPVYEMLALVSGIKPASPGFEAVRIAPDLNGLGEISTEMPHHKGNIQLELKESKNGKLKGRVTLPPGLSGTFAWKGQELPLQPGENKVSF